MKEQVTNLWDHYMVPDKVICITTNGFVKMDGRAVCGRGCALEATERIPGFARMLGRRIRTHGNVAGMMKTDPAEWGVFVFPVKHNWWENATMWLIVSSAQALSEEAESNPLTTFYLPRPGCGNGHLDWKNVKKEIEFLPDNVVAVTK